MASCQITGIPEQTWRAFRRICLDEGVSANRKLRQLIEAQVVRAVGGMDGKSEITEPKAMESKGRNYGRR